MRAKSLQSCQTLCDPLDCSPPGSSVHRIFLARILEWVAKHSSKGIFQTQGSNPHLLTRPVLTGRFHTTSATWEATFLYTWSVVNQLHSDLDESCARISVTSIKNTAVGFPGGPARNLPVSAGDTSSIPALGIKIPQAAWQRLNPRASTAEATHLEPVLHNRRSHRNEKPAHCNWRAALACCN